METQLEFPSESEPLPPSRLAMRLKWDVFLSFRGEDTRNGFTKALYEALIDSRVRTFMDNEGLQGGDEIDPSLNEAIHDSAAAIAVISPRYADSHWCLEELARLFHCNKLVVPVFYQVDPSHVRRQIGTFEVVKGHHSDENVERWKRALTMVGVRSGYLLGKHSDESHAIKMIVSMISTELSRIPAHAVTYAVGLDSRVDEAIKRLNLQSNDVQFLGIHGQPGIGKTTLAKAVFIRLLPNFKRHCFISLQEQCSVDDENSGKPAILRLISNDGQYGENSRVLIVLDDVVRSDQLEAIGIQRERFTEGSRIIATSTDIDVLCSVVYEDELYEAKELLPSEALELFSYHSLRRKKPTEKFLNLSKEIISLTGGLPLAVEVFGSVLLDKRTKREWEKSLDKLRTIRPSNLQDVLKVSYEELDDEENKCIFLDISCLLIQAGMKRAEAIDIFNGCGFTAEEAIQLLLKKSLLKITKDDFLWMHDQIRDMGRRIVTDQGTDCIRLWNFGDIRHILKENIGTANVRGIILHNRRKKLMLNSLAARTSYLLNDWRNIFFETNDSDINIKSFQSLKSLKLLLIDEVEFKGDVNYIKLPSELQWLRWKRCPWKNLPSSLPQEIRVLDLSDSHLQYLWSPTLMFCNNNQVVKNLIVLNLSNNNHLTSIPDLSGHCILKKLVLEGCVKLNRIDESLGHMTSLVHLNLRRCTTLTDLPRDISGLKRLEEFILSECTALLKLPSDFKSLTSLRELHLDGTPIQELPSLFHLTRLELMVLNRCINLKCLPSDIGNMRSLKILSLSGSGLEILPDSIGKLEFLEKLKLECCASMKSIPDSVGNLKSLSLLDLTSTSISKLPDSCYTLPFLKCLSLANCSIRTLSDKIGGMSSIVNLRLDGIQIQELPHEICSLKVIQSLELRSCTRLIKLPESIGNLFSLSVLNLEDTPITMLPSSIGDLENLVTLCLNRCKRLNSLPSTFGKLKSVRHLCMEETAITDLPETIRMLSNLQGLEFDGTKSCQMIFQILASEKSYN